MSLDWEKAFDAGQDGQSCARETETLTGKTVRLTDVLEYGCVCLRAFLEFVAMSSRRAVYDWLA